MSKVTLLETIAQAAVAHCTFFDAATGKACSGCERDAATLRAADAVVKAAGNRLSLGWHMSCSPNACRCGQTELDIALAAFHKIERGE